MLIPFSIIFAVLLGATIGLLGYRLGQREGFEQGRRSVGLPAEIKPETFDPGLSTDGMSDPYLAALQDQDKPAEVERIPTL